MGDGMDSDQFNSPRAGRQTQPATIKKEIPQKKKGEESTCRKRRKGREEKERKDRATR